jgi:hypothetical protein
MACCVYQQHISPHHHLSPFDPQKRAKTGRNAGKILPAASVNGQTNKKNG